MRQPTRLENGSAYRACALHTRGTRFRAYLPYRARARRDSPHKSRRDAGMGRAQMCVLGKKQFHGYLGELIISRCGGWRNARAIKSAARFPAAP